MAQNDEFIFALRNANPIETVISSYIQLKRRGRNYVCNCPFHSEKTPSFTVFPDSQNFYCFGCGAGGDVITFIMKSENLDFMEAVKLLAQRCGMEVPERNNHDSQLAKRRTRIYEMNRIAANYFHHNLVNGSDKAGLQYLFNRRLAPETVKKFGLGYSSNSWNELTDLLISKGYSEDEIIDAWLGGRSQKSGKIYDMFHGRVMFPIVDLRGNIIGFGGRVLDDSTPKYLNTGKTPVFDKGSNLFSMNYAKNSNSKRLILCEGYMDVIAVNQAGLENAVATLGTAITPNQARLMSHYAEEVIIAYDSDSAGQTAAKRAISHFSDVGIKTRILRMEDAKDPDEYIKKFGVQRFRRLIEGSDDANNFMLDRCEDGIDINTEAGKVELLKKTAAFLSEMQSPLEREVYISRTAKKYDFPVEVLKSHIDDIIRKKEYADRKNQWRNIKSQASVPRDNINPQAAHNKKEAKAEETIICYLLKNPEKSKEIGNEAPVEIFVTDFNKKVYQALLKIAAECEFFSLSLLNNEFSTEEMGKINGMEVKYREIPIDHKAFTDCTEVLKKYRVIDPDNITDDYLQDLLKNKKH